ncbi:MAG: MMPL family transporter [Rhodospirillales bacterium]|nr:MMPL family transporter [Rhodospirillales bacterium]
MKKAADAYRRNLAAWVAGVCRYARATVLMAICATAAAMYGVATQLTINTDTEDMLSADLAFRRDSNALSAAFPQLSDNIVVVIDGATPDLADEAAMALARRLREKPQVFGTVFDPPSEPFFRANGLLYMDVEELSDLADRLAEAQPFLGTLWRDASLRGLADMLGLVVDEVTKEKAAAPFDMARVLNAIAEVAERQAAGRFGLLSWELLMGNADDDADARRRLIVIQPALDFASLAPAERAMEVLREIARDLDLDSEHGVRVRLTGSAALAQEELASVGQGMGLAAALSLTLVAVLLVAGLGSPRLAGATVATLLMGLSWTAAFALMAIGSLNLISVAFAVLFIGLSVDFGIHFGLRYREAVDGGARHEMALERAASGVGGALTLSAVAAAIGFFSFLPTDYRGLAELGLIAGVGMFIALFANVTVLPALLTLRPLSPQPARRALMHSGVGGRPCRAIAWGALALGLAAAFVVPAARFDFDPLNLKDPDTESVATLFDLMERSRTSPYSITVLAPNLDDAAALARRLSALDEVESTSTLLDYVPKNQQEKLAVIEDMALFLAPAFAAAPVETSIDAATRLTAVTALRDDLDRLARAAEGAPLKDAAGRLSKALAPLIGGGTSAPGVLEGLERRLMTLLPGRLRALSESLNAGPVTLDDLPDDLRRRQVAADGRARVAVYPRENLHQHQALRRFVAAVRTVAPHATGSPVVILEAGNTVVGAFRDAAVMAIIAIAVLLAVLLRRPGEVALVFAPLVLAALLTVAASVLFGLPFNYANVIVLPLLFGLGVANGIHLVLRRRDEGGIDRVMASSTPRAVVFSALTTIGSFASIALSSHPGTASMGMLLTIAITLTLACTLIVLPVLMALDEEKREGMRAP